jgi:hypothetical protein
MGTLDRSPSDAHEKLGRLVASGLITALSGPRGTRLSLLPNQLGELGANSGRGRPQEHYLAAAILKWGALRETGVSLEAAE